MLGTNFEDSLGENTVVNGEESILSYRFNENFSFSILMLKSKKMNG